MLTRIFVFLTVFTISYQAVFAQQSNIPISNSPVVSETLLVNPSYPGTPPSGPLTNVPSRRAQPLSPAPSPPLIPRSQEWRDSASAPVIPGDPKIEALKEKKAKEAAAAIDADKKSKAEQKQAEAASARTLATPLATASEGANTPTFETPVEPKVPGPADNSLPQPPKAASTGSYSQQVEIKVPAFRGHEPKLALAYDSSAGARSGGHFAGYVGNGWSLQGLSEIVRVSPGRGTPAADASDTWTLDGEELVLCGPNIDSPSCKSGHGGTHTTRVESYRRIVFDASLNSWTVTSKDGSRSVYKALTTWAADTYTPYEGYHWYYYRYLLEKMVDTNGNEVVFSYRCQKYPACVPEAITYGPHQIRFYSETRPDPAFFVTGAGSMQFDRRLKAIDVTTSGSRARAYALSYDVSPASGSSRLTSVREYGKTAAVATNGVVSGSDALPPEVFTYSGQMLSIAAASNALTLPVSVFGSSGYTVCEAVIPPIAPLFLDFNRDKRIDIFRINDIPGLPDEGGAPCTINFAKMQSWPLLNVGSSFSQGNYLDFERGIISKRFSFSGDFSGDGRDVALFLSGEWRVTGAQQANFSAALNGFAISVEGNEALAFSGESIRTILGREGRYEAQTQVLVADFDGDGRAEALLLAGMSGVIIRKPQSTFEAVATSVIGWPISTLSTTPPNYTLRAADIDGDGKSEVIITTKLTNSGVIGNKIRIFVLKFQSGLFHATEYYHDLPDGVFVDDLDNWNGGARAPITQTGDFDGDGKADLLFFQQLNAARARAHVLRFLGGSNVASNNVFGFQRMENTLEVDMQFTSSASGARNIHVGDYDGDGRSDLVTSGVWNRADIHFSKPDGFTSFSITNPNISNNTLNPFFLFSPGDLDGDGKADLFFVNDSTSIAGSPSALSKIVVPAQVPDLLVTTTGVMGGTTQISYTPSSLWQNNRMSGVSQTVTSITQSDGWGNNGTTMFTYSGGLYDARERKFLGYRNATVTYPQNSSEAAAPLKRYTFGQSRAHAGRVIRVQHGSTAALNALSGSAVTVSATPSPWKTERCDDTGLTSAPANVMRDDCEEITFIDTDVPYRRVSTATERREYLTGGVSRSRVERQHDMYGNITRQIERGDVRFAAQEKTTVTSFFPNTNAYIVARPGV